MGFLERLGITPPMPEEELEAILKEETKRMRINQLRTNYREFRGNLRLMGIPGLPTDFDNSKADGNAVNTMDRFTLWAPKFRACWLCGVPGCGKTTLIHIAIRKALKNRKTVAHINCRYLSRIFPAFDQPEEVRNIGRNLVKWASSADLLCIDDFGYEEIAPKLQKDEFKRWMIEIIDRIELDKKKYLIIGSEYTAAWFKDGKTYGLATNSLMSRLRGLTEKGQETLLTGGDRRGR